MEKILQIIAKETYGQSYHTSRVELAVENETSQIEYDFASEIVLKNRAETFPPVKYVSLESAAQKFYESKQILNYFLDGSRRVFKIDDVAYMNGSRKMIYPIVAAQVVAGCCRRIERKMHVEKFSSEIILAVPDIANPRSFDERFFPALVNQINSVSKINISKIIPYNTSRKTDEKFENRAVAKIMEHMHDTEKNLVAELVSRGKLDEKKLSGELRQSKKLQAACRKFTLTNIFQILCLKVFLRL